ncbi:hypothetical protein [Aquimarina rhabdastrellae]
MLRLEPTIELKPWDYLGDKVHKIIGTDSWKEYWDNFLKTINLIPVYSGSLNIAINQIEDVEVIKKIANIAINDGLSINDIYEKTIPLEGGYVLFENDKIVVMPQCCCNLGDLNYWKELASIASTDWYNLSMGHALMYGRKTEDENVIEIKEVAEYGDYEPIIEKVNKKDLEEALVVAEQKVEVFENKFVLYLDDILNDHELSIKIGKKLLGKS